MTSTLQNQSLPESNRPFLVAGVQMVSGANLAQNLAQAAILIAQAAGQGARLIALPEYFCLMGHRESDKFAIKEVFGTGPIQSFLSEQAKLHQVYLVGGTLPIASDYDSHVFNTTLVFDPNGKQIARYDKIHLFHFKRGEESYDEARTMCAGQTPVTFNSPIGSVGLSVCYDLRFPELYRSLGEVSLLVIPAAFVAVTGRAHWEILLRARAIENQCYVLAPAQGGKHENGRLTWGHTLLIDPWGTILAELDQGAGTVVGTVDLAHLQGVRNSLPALKHRRL